ncbi:hypothetical protein FB45DRAFT_1112804 [Roridomyces roridus]|uniref:Uncharacterized protein n=1 Tax=Roridomyces roridus TaxID=1738132 RepID=A0AAD7FD55_9AGAR|nr:hypothetical protein FB45DRAFT_1112804 [Roridomyces roridus]
MSSTLRLHGNICITAAGDEHPDLPKNMRIFAQVIVNNYLVWETFAGDQEQAGQPRVWTIKMDCNISMDTETFCIAILREAKGIRLLGFVEIAKDRGLLEEGQKAFRLPLTTVNGDGPKLQLTLDCSTSMSQSMGLTQRDTGLEIQSRAPLEMRSYLC